jgi:flagellin-like protein
MEKKKGVSPVIATVLLIVIAIIIAIIILLWFQLFYKEKLLKFDKPIESVCSEVSIRTFVNEDDSFGFTNIGNVPIYRANLKTTSQGSSETFEISKGIDAGFSTVIEGYKYSDYEQVEIIPVLLGKSKDGGVNEFVCEKNGFVV